VTPTIVIKIEQNRQQGIRPVKRFSSSKIFMKYNMKKSVWFNKTKDDEWVASSHLNIVWESAPNKYGLLKANY